MNYSDKLFTCKQLMKLEKRTQILKKCLPNWYVELSARQKSAADELSQDLTQGLTRLNADSLKDALRKMGLRPVPRSRHLWLAMRMSHCNVLAFLWFLMELSYKSSDDSQSYNLNEQITMSTIYQLDLVPTINALDRLLPLPRRSVKRRRNNVPHMRQSQIIMMSPFESCLQPPQPVLRRVSLPQLVRKCPSGAQIPATISRDYDDYELSNRWFGNFPPNDDQRPEINRIFESFRAARLHSADVQTLCLHQRRINAMEASLRRDFEKIKLEYRQSMADVTTKFQERCRRKVQAELDDLTAHYERQFHAKALQTRLATTSKILSAPRMKGDACCTKNWQDFPKVHRDCPQLHRLTHFLDLNPRVSSTRTISSSYTSNYSINRHHHKSKNLALAIDKDVELLNATMTPNIEQQQWRLSPFKFDQHLYNPNNLNHMRELVRLALQHIAQDRRYILPTLPQVHCVPFLVEWMRRRYANFCSSWTLASSNSHSKANII